MFPMCQSCSHSSFHLMLSLLCWQTQVKKASHCSECWRYTMNQNSIGSAPAAHTANHKSGWQMHRDWFLGTMGYWVGTPNHPEKVEISSDLSATSSPPACLPPSSPGILWPWLVSLQICYRNEYIIHSSRRVIPVR